MQEVVTCDRLHNHERQSLSQVGPDQKFRICFRKLDSVSHFALVAGMLIAPGEIS